MPVGARPLHALVVGDSLIARSATAVVLVALAGVSTAGTGPAKVTPGESRGWVQRWWTTRNGLPQSSVLAIAQTPDGYLWVGTQEGLARFDGSSMRELDMGHEVLRRRWVAALLVDRDGTLVVGFGGRGIAFHRSGRFDLVDPGDLSSSIVTSLGTDRTGALWIGTEGGLFLLEDGRFQPASGDPALAESITAVRVTTGGEVWAATASDVGRRDPSGHWISERERLGAARPLFEDSTGALWLGTAGGEVLALRGSGLTRYGRAQGLGGEPATSAAEDREGAIWVGTRRGVYRLEGERFALVADVGPVTALSVDAEGSTWVGTESSGLLQLRRAKVTTFGRASGLPGENVYSIHASTPGITWMGIRGGGVVRVEGGSVTGRWTAADGLPSNEVTSVLALADGTVWVGLVRGLAVIRNDRVHPGPELPGLDTDEIHALHVDRQGRLWIGTWRHGLYSVDRGLVTHLGVEDGLADDAVYAIAETGAGSLLAGTRAGVSLVRNGAIVRDQTLAVMNGLPIMAIHEDAGARLWLGTYRNGLHLLQGSRHVVFDTDRGLFNDTVFHVLADDLGNLWMSCNQGLFSVPVRELLAVAGGAASRVTSVVYGLSEGTEEVEANGSWQPGALRAADGRLWFPTIGGAVIVDPAVALRQRNLVPPPLHIEEVLWNGKRLQPDAAGHLTTPPGAGQLEIHYVGLSFVAPEEMRFRYRLAGSETSWVDAGNRRVAYYPSTPPGQYRFQLQAANSDGVWSPELSLPLAVAPHFYQTALARLLLIAFGLGLALGAYRLATQRMRLASAVAAERERLAQELHDGLTQCLTGILIQLEVALETAPQLLGAARAHVERARDWARHSLTEARIVVTALDASVTSVPVLAAALRRCTEVLTAGTAVQVELSSTAEPVALAPAVGTALLRIAQEALANAVRHGQPRLLEVKLAASRSGEVTLAVRDDGRGFDPAAQPAAGKGLTGMRARAARIGAAIDVKSHPGEGSVVTVTVGPSSCLSRPAAGPTSLRRQ